MLVLIFLYNPYLLNNIILVSYKIVRYLEK